MILEYLLLAKMAVATCKQNHILPVRYALTSEENPPIYGKKIYPKDIPDINNYKFTLRTIKKGYIFIYYTDSKKIDVYAAKGNRFRKISEPSETGKGEPTICIPQNTQKFFIRYIRLPEVDTDAQIYLLNDIAKNLKSNVQELMQEVVLKEETYDAPFDDFSSYVEEYRRNPGYLSYLPCWGRNNDILKFSRKTLPHRDNPCFAKRWKASADKVPWQQGTFCKSTRLVALHDCIGNLLDCVSIQARSLKAIAYFQQWHAPLLQSSILTDTVAELRVRKAAENTKGLAHRNRLVKAAGYSAGLIPADAVADAASVQLNTKRSNIYKQLEKNRADEFARLDKTFMRRCGHVEAFQTGGDGGQDPARADIGLLHKSKGKYLDAHPFPIIGYETKDLMDWVSPDVLLGAAFTQWKEHTNSKWERKIQKASAEKTDRFHRRNALVGALNQDEEGILPDTVLAERIRDYLKAHPNPLTGNYTTDMLLWLEGIDIHYKKRVEYIKKLDADIKELRNSMLPFARDWAAILACEKRFSLSETLCKVFKSDDQASCPHSTLSTPLTTSRDEIFCMCQSGIAELTEYFPILDELFEKNATFGKLWQEVIGKGGVPQGSFSAWLCSLIPYVEHRVSASGITDPLLAQILDTCSRRLHCASPAQDRGKTDPKEALRMAFVLTENGKTWRDALPDLSDVAFSSKLFKTLKEGLLNPVKEYYQTLLEDAEKLSPAGQGDAGQAPDSSTTTKDSFQRPHVYEDAKTAESKAQPLRAYDTTIYLRYTSAMEALIKGCRTFAVLTSVANLCAIAKELLRAHQQGEAYSTLNALGKALPSALTLIQEFRTVCLQQTVGVLFRGAVIAAGLVAAGVTFAEMWRKDQDQTAMVGRMTMELALILIPFSGKVAAFLGLHLLATGAVFVLLIAGGFTLFYVCKDSEEVEFLKNSLWNKKDAYAAYYAALEETDSQKFILDDDEVTSVEDMEIPSSPIWREVHAVLKKQASKFIYPNVAMAMGREYLYVNIKLLRMHSDIRIKDDLSIEVTLKGHMQESARLYGSSDIAINTYYKTLNVSPVCEEMFHAEEYLVYEMIFDRQAINSCASGNDGETWLGLSCLASLSKGDIALEGKTYYQDLLSLRYAATPEVEKRISDLLTGNPTTNARKPA